jgi:hypothetical protein
MRLWSLHPRYLDARGLVALWREALLARRVLSGATKGYRRHPQLERFRTAVHPLRLIEAYLVRVYKESVRRGYRFNQLKLSGTGSGRLTVNDGQLRYELKHLKRKLKTRDPERYRELCRVRQPLPHPLFTVKRGPVAAWERLPGSKK